MLLTPIFTILIAHWLAFVDNSEKQVGTLTCVMIAEALDHEQLSCTFKPEATEAVEEFYAGRLSSPPSTDTQKLLVTWTVRTKTGEVAPGGLEGTFAAPLALDGSEGVLVSRDIRLEPKTAAGSAPSPPIGGITLERYRPRV